MIMLTHEEQKEFDELCNSPIYTPERLNRYNYLHAKSFKGATKFIRCNDGTPYIPVGNA